MSEGYERLVGCYLKRSTFSNKNFSKKTAHPDTQTHILGKRRIKEENWNFLKMSGMWQDYILQLDNFPLAKIEQKMCVCNTLAASAG